MKKSSFVSFRDVELGDGFWHDRYDLNKRVSVKNVRERFEETGRFDALRFNFLKTGRRPHVFFDSDAAKWMEAVAYLYEKDPVGTADDIALCEELIDCMERAQRPGGYLNSTHQQITPETIFMNRNDHELYCAGHLIEAAVAYHRATGRDRFLRIMERYCDCIGRAFITEKTAAFTTPGHEEIELALIKLYRHTGERKYLEMARFFLENRAKAENEKHPPDGNPKYFQDDADIYNLKEANGHCVRALYLYCGIADLAAETGDGRLTENLRSVFSDITLRKMYITGGVGSTYRGESFTVPYDLPNFTAYTESCAAIAMVLFAVRMRELDTDARPLTDQRVYRDRFGKLIAAHIYCEDGCDRHRWVKPQCPVKGGEGVLDAPLHFGHECNYTDNGEAERTNHFNTALKLRAETETVF